MPRCFLNLYKTDRAAEGHRYYIRQSHFCCVNLLLRYEIDYKDYSFVRKIIYLFIWLHDICLDIAILPLTQSIVLSTNYRCIDILDLSIVIIPCDIDITMFETVIFTSSSVCVHTHTGHRYNNQNII